MGQLFVILHKFCVELKGLRSLEPCVILHALSYISVRYLVFTIALFQFFFFPQIYRRLSHNFSEILNPLDLVFVFVFALNDHTQKLVALFVLLEFLLLPDLVVVFMAYVFHPSYHIFRK